MRLAQQLYEGVDIKGHGTVGLITYLRTDSTRVAAEADTAAREFIKAQYGGQYVAAEAAARSRMSRFRTRMRRSGRPTSP